MNNVNPKNKLARYRSWATYILKNPTKVRQKHEGV